MHHVQMGVALMHAPNAFIAAVKPMSVHSTSDSTLLEHSEHFSAADEFRASPPTCARVHNFILLH